MDPFTQLQSNPLYLQQQGHYSIFQQPYDAMNVQTFGQATATLESRDAYKSTDKSLRTASAASLPTNATFPSTLLQQAGINPQDHKPELRRARRWFNSGEIPMQVPEELKVRPGYKRVIDWSSYKQDSVEKALGFSKAPIQFHQPSLARTGIVPTYRKLTESEQRDPQAYLFVEDAEFYAQEDSTPKLQNPSSIGNATTNTSPNSSANANAKASANPESDNVSLRQKQNKKSSSSKGSRTKKVDPQYAI